MQSKDKKIKHSFSKGFSLIEIMISMAIFTVIIGAVVLFSVRTLDAHSKSQAMQNAVENARFVTETVNKKIRTSHDISDDDNSDGTDFSNPSNWLFFVDNVDGSKVCYRFNDNKLLVARAPDSVTHEDCADFTFPADFIEVVGGASTNIEVNGGFFIKETDITGARDRGFVRTVIEIKYNQGSLVASDRDTVVIQSGVSLRDY